MKKGCIFGKVFKLGRMFKFLFKALSVTFVVLFTVYMLNLDMKLVGWLYTVLNKFHDRKPRDISF